VKKQFLLTTIFILGSLLASAQCSMCKAVAETGGGKAAGLNDAILYLMAVPYVLLFIFFRKKIWSFLKELRSLWN
jgi:hypothetical protein